MGLAKQTEQKFVRNQLELTTGENLRTVYGPAGVTWAETTDCAASICKELSRTI